MSVNDKRNPEAVWTGPLSTIMAKSYTNGAIAGGIATGFCFGLDKYLTTPVQQPRWPAYAKVMPQHRWYGYILGCLAVFQYFVEDTEIAGITDKNHQTFLEDLEDERAFIEQMEHQKGAAAKKPTNTTNTV